MRLLRHQLLRTAWPTLRFDPTADADVDVDVDRHMVLLRDPSLAEVPDLPRHVLTAVARSVEERRQQLERDIEDYIRRKQEALRCHEQELIAHYRSMASTDSAAPSPSPSSSPASTVSQQKTKRPKHTRVHKREKELYGLVTPVFLPLLDARQTPHDPSSEKQPAPTDPDAALPSRPAEKSKDTRKSRKEPCDSHSTAADADADADALKKVRRSVVSKSSLRHKDSPRQRRNKRVSLIIDGQTVLPADTVIEPTLASPTSEATSTSTSTASLDDLIDPRLTRPSPSTQLSQNHAVHHSLPLTTARFSHSHNLTHSHHPTPAKTLPRTKPAIPSAALPATTAPNPKFAPIMSSPPRPPARSPTMSLGAPQSVTRTFLDPPPLPVHPPSPPTTNTSINIAPKPVDPTLELDANDLANDNDEHWDTYVGGLHGSGVDNVDQAGSYGYPSSLGASYLESYMQNRPLSVRMQTADKVGLSEREKWNILEEKRCKEVHNEAGLEAEDDEEFGLEITSRRREVDDDDMDIVGSMEGL